MLSAATLVQLGATALLNAALALMVGAVALALGQRSVQGLHGQDALWSRRALVGGAAAALVGSGLLLWWQAAAMAEVPLTEAWSAIAPVLTGTHYGRAWSVGLASLLLVLALGLWRRTTDRAGGALLLAGLGVAVFAASRSAVSHASGGELGFYALVDWAHLLLISLWVGEVFLALTWMTRSIPNDHQLTGPQAAQRVDRLSTTATWALVGVGITGALLSWNGLGAQPQTIFTSEYGWALTTKLALVAFAVALGGYNRFVTMPKLMPGLAASARQASGPWARFAAVLKIEAAVLVAVLFAAAVLATRPPPG